MRVMLRFCYAILVVMIAAGCSKRESEDIILSNRVYPDYESWTSQITLTKDGKKRAVVNAGHLKKYNEIASIFLDDGVDVDFFNAEGEYLSHLVCEKATIHERSNDMIAQGKVVVTSNSNINLYTEELRWDNNKEKIVSDSFVTFITERDTLAGHGFESDPSLENWVIYRPSGVTDRELEK